MKALRFVMPALLLVCGFAAPAAAAPPDSLVTLRGRVVEARTGEPLPGASVFLAGAMRGAAADRDGRWVIADAPVAYYEVVASVVGFRSQAREYTPSEHAGQREVTLDFFLEEQTIALDSVLVEAEGASLWRRQLERFETHFLGAGPGGQVRILNPYVLSFYTPNPAAPWEGQPMTAEAAAPLEIENRLLGYRLTFVLRAFLFDPDQGRVQFVGWPFFREMEPSSPEEAARRREAREAAYAGSTMHLFRALFYDRTEAEGFTLELPLENGRFVRVEDRRAGPAPEATQKTLRARGRLRVVYRRAEPSRARRLLFGAWADEESFLRFETGSITIYPDGSYSPSYSVVRYGAMGERRIAHLLPREYGAPRILKLRGAEAAPPDASAF